MVNIRRRGMDNFSKLRNEDFVFSFRGILTTSLMERIFKDIEEGLLNLPVKKIYRKRIFNILVELIQNTFKHSFSLPERYREALITVQRINEGLEITAGNYLHKDLISALRNRFNMINSLPENEIKELYMGVLSMGSHNTAESAGIGFIEIAKKSKNTINFRFDDVNESFSFFTLKTTVKTTPAVQ